MRVLTVLGARPQFIKAAMVTRAINRADGCREIMVHTGQHFDTNMSDVFFEELEIPSPEYHLNVGGGSHGQNTGRMLEAIESVLLQELPDAMLVYGDTDSTLAGALAAAKVHVPIIHVEAGLRSFNKRMPEEVNRLLTDHLSALLLTPTDLALSNLAAEGISGPRVINVGDVMFDAALFFGARAEIHSQVLRKYSLSSRNYCLATIHRQENTDDPHRLKRIFEGLAVYGRKVVLPLHPRTRQRIVSHEVKVSDNVQIIDPLGYIDMVMLEKHANLIVTDSGGVQKEAYFHGVPCLTLRDETEWVELVDMGWNRLASPVSENFLELFEQEFSFGKKEVHPYGDGFAADRIVCAFNLLNSTK